MYKQNCIQNNFLFLHDRLNWLFHIFIYIYKNILPRKWFFVMCNKKLYQTPLSLSQKKCIKWYNLLFSITLDFVIPNSSNHCTLQRIFIMYSYVHIMFYFCMCDGRGDRGGSLAAARWQQQRQLGGGSCGSLAAAAWWRQLGSSSGSAAAVAAVAVAALQ